MNLTGRPVSQKPEKVRPRPEYLDAVRGRPCEACGKHGPSEAHHCRDKPDHDDRWRYDRIPGAAQKSSDLDAIPLCQHCHWLFHNRRGEFHALYGRDYFLIEETRRALGLQC